MKINGDLIIDDTNTKLKDAINPTFSYSQMKTTFTEKKLTSETIIKDYGYGINMGDFAHSPSGGWIKVPAGSAKLIQLTGVICGNGYCGARYCIQDSSGTEMNYNNAGLSYQGLGVLYQFGGNYYWKAPMPTVNIRIPDTTKDWYVYLAAGPYQQTEFNMNAGFGACSWFGVAKLA